MPDTQENLSQLRQELAEFLRSNVDKNAELNGELSRLQGGFDTDTYAFRVANVPPGFPQELVLRHFQHTSENKRVVLESTIQNAAANAGHPVPLVPIDTSGHPLANRPFILMERLPGTALGTQLEDPTTLQQLPKILANLQTGLHSLDPAGLKSQLAESGVDLKPLSPHAMLMRVGEMTQACDEYALVSVHSWLSDNWPDQPQSPVICHGDFHPNNVLYMDGKVTGLIDWGNVMFTHREFDVAITRTTLSVGPPDVDAETRVALQPLIDRLVHEYVDSYRSVTPIDVELVGYYTALRATHAYAKVICHRQGINMPYISGDGYAWGLPLLFGTITRSIEKVTGVQLGSD